MHNIMNISSSKNKISSKKQCDICCGSGFVKTTPISCNICNGVKCIQCKSTGLSVMPYELCEKCDSSGEIMV